MKTKKKSKKVKLRVKVAPPSKKHKSEKDYNRKKNDKKTYESAEDEICQTPPQSVLDQCDEEKQKRHLAELESLFQGPEPKQDPLPFWTRVLNWFSK
jgi:hypothetical protein